MVGVEVSPKLWKFKFMIASNVLQFEEICDILWYHTFEKESATVMFINDTQEAE